jgi:hypothetical protein
MSKRLTARVDRLERRTTLSETWTLLVSPSPEELAAAERRGSTLVIIPDNGRGDYQRPVPSGLRLGAPGADHQP